jgi:hypothetical protein
MDASPSTLSRLRLLYCAFIGKDAGQGGLLQPRWEISSQGAPGYWKDVKETTIIWRFTSRHSPKTFT